jgi:hypothetical protein
MITLIDLGSEVNRRRKLALSPDFDSYAEANVRVTQGPASGREGPTEGVGTFASANSGN